MAVTVDRDLCVDCGACVEECESGALENQDGTVQSIPEKCTDCGDCIEVCPSDALKKV